MFRLVTSDWTQIYLVLAQSSLWGTVNLLCLWTYQDEAMG